MRERERWRNIRRAPEGYRVSSYGNAKSPGGPLTPTLDEDGRRSVKICGEKVRVATLVLEAFDRPRPYGMEACHGDLGTSSDALANLRWDTHRENMRDKLREREDRNGKLVSHPPLAVTAVTGDVQR